MESMWVFSCKRVWEHWLVCPRNSKEMHVDNAAFRSLLLRHEFSGNRESNSTNSQRVIDHLVFWGTWAVREEGCWTCEELVPSSSKSKLVTREGFMSCCWQAMDGDGDCEGCRAETPWLGAETDWSFWSGKQEIRVLRATGLKLGFAFGGTPPLQPPCCPASFSAMLFELPSCWWR